MNTQSIKGTGHIINLQVCQHRLKLLLWLIGIIGVSIAVGAGYDAIYQTDEDLIGLAVTMQNPAMTAMLGPAQAVEDYTVSVAFASEMLMFTAIGVAIMNILLASAMTRMDEDEGRLELVQSLSVGRVSYPLAAMIILFIANVVIALAIGFGLYAFGSESFTLEGSLLYGAIQAATGLFFAGVTLVVAQLCDTNRSTRALSFSMLIISYVIRAVGDVTNDTLSYFSPLGWTVRSNVFVENDWWPVMALTGGATVLLIIAFWLNSRRDLFSGILPQRPGKKSASGFLKTLPGFVWSQEKTMMISWTVGIFLLAVSFGSILGELETYFSDMEILQAFLGDSGNLTEEFIILLFSIMSLFVAVPGVSLILSVKGLESNERIDNILSRTVSRTSLIMTYIIIAAIFVVILQGLLGLGMYLSANQVMDDPLSLAQFMETAMLYVPSIWFMIALVTLLVGWLPKASGLIWLYLVFAFMVTYLGELLDFPEWLNNLSVFFHVPTEVDWPVLTAITGLVIVLGILGVAGYNNRDID